MSIDKNRYKKQVDNVYEGKSVFIDWKSGLEPAIYARFSFRWPYTAGFLLNGQVFKLSKKILGRFSTAGGDPLVHLASNPVFMPNFPGWAFFKVIVTEWLYSQMYSCFTVQPMEREI